MSGALYFGHTIHSASPQVPRCKFSKIELQPTCRREWNASLTPDNINRLDIVCCSQQTLALNEIIFQMCLKESIYTMLDGSGGVVYKTRKALWNLIIYRRCKSNPL